MSPTSHVTKSDKQLINRAYKCNKKKGNGKGKGKGKRKKKRKKRRRRKKKRRQRKKKRRRRKKKGKRRKKKGRRKKIGKKRTAEMDMIDLTKNNDDNLTNFVWVPSEKGNKSWNPGRWKVKDFV